MKIELTLESIDHDFLIACLERYLETLHNAGLMREVATLIEKIDNNYKEID